MKFILFCGCRWKWRVIIAVNFSNLSYWKEEAWKISGHQRDSNPWPPWHPLLMMNCVKTLSKWMWNHERRHFRKDNKTSLVKTFTMWQLRVKLESLHILETRTYKGSQGWCCHNSLLIKPVNTKLLMLGTRQVLQRLPAVILFGEKVSPARAFVFSKLYHFWTKLLILLLSLFFLEEINSRGSQWGLLAYITILC